MYDFSHLYIIKFLLRGNSVVYWGAATVIFSNLSFSFTFFQFSLVSSRVSNGKLAIPVPRIGHPVDLGQGMKIFHTSPQVSQLQVRRVAFVLLGGWTERKRQRLNYQDKLSSRTCSSNSMCPSLNYCQSL